MLPDNFDFAMLPPGNYNLREIGMLSSTIETIDYSIVSWLKEDLNLSINSNDGNLTVPILWQAPEIAKNLRKYSKLHKNQ